jgi:hypothetical protein
MRSSCVKIGNRLYEMPRRAATTLHTALSGLPGAQEQQHPDVPVIALRSQFSDFKKIENLLLVQHHTHMSLFRKITFDAADTSTFIASTKKLSSWVSGQSEWMTMEWFTNVMEPILFGVSHWCVPTNEYETMGTPETFFLSKVVIQHPDPKAVFETMASINAHVSGSTGVVSHWLSTYLHTGKSRADLDALPTIQQWDTALFGKDSINDQLLHMPPVIILPVLSSL